jgi:hypothetical protein
VVRFRKLLSIGVTTSLSVVSAVLMTAATASPAAASTLVVDDDGDQCPGATFTTAAGIQLAIDAAVPGDTISVCPGTYSKILVPKTLTIQATQTGQASHCFQPPTPPDENKEAIIQGDLLSPPAVMIAADNVVFDGFTVQNGLPGIQTTSVSSGYHISHNLVQNNTFGLYFHSSGATQSVAFGNCFRTNNAGGAATGNGIYTDQGLHNALIRNNLFTGHTNASIILAENTSDVTITRNVAINDSSIAAFLSSNLTIDHNFSSNPAGSAIFIGGGVTPATIDSNVLRGGAQSSNGISIRSDAGVTPLPNPNVTVSANNIRSFPLNGVRLGTGATSDIVSGNQSVGNTQAGIHALDGATNNTIQNNFMRNNNPDCQDDTTGTATAGTANTWVNNDGKTSVPPGLCQPAKCHEGDGGGDFDGNHGHGNVKFDGDGCRDGDQDQVDSDNRGDGKDFHSMTIDSVAVDSLANAMTITGTGTSNGLPVTFVLVAVGGTPLTLGSVTMTFSDGYTNTGDLSTGSIAVQ